MTQLLDIDSTAAALAQLAGDTPGTPGTPAPGSSEAGAASPSPDAAKDATWGDVDQHFLGIPLSGASGGGASVGGGRPTSPYRQVPPVRAAVSRKATALGSLPMLISTADDRLIESGPLFDLIDSPSTRMSRVEFWQTTSAWLDLTGACHWVFTLVGDRPIEIVPVSAWQMKPIYQGGDKSGDLIGWKYRPRGKRWDQALTLGLDEVWTVGLDSFDPSEPFGYSSPLEAAGLAVAQIYKADLANESSLDNGVEPGGAFTMPGQPTEDQVTDMRAQLVDRHAGVGKRRRPLLLYGGMDWKQIAASFDDMEFSTLQKMKVVDVCVALDIDPAAIGYYEDSNYAHAEAAKEGAWIDTHIPRGEWLADEFTRGVVSRFEGRSRTGVDTAPMQRSRRMSASYRSARAASRAPKRSMFVWFDSTRVPAVRRALLARSKEGSAWIHDYKATPADVIECLDLPLPVHPWQEHGWQAIGEMPITPLAPGNMDGEMDPDGSPTPAEEPDDNDADPTDDDARGVGTPEQHARALQENALAALWGRWRSSWRGLERSTRGRVSKHFAQLRKQVLANLEGELVGRCVAPDRTKDLIGEVLFDLVDANRQLDVRVSPLIRESFRLGGNQAMGEHADATGQEEPTPFNIADEQVVNAIRRRRIELTGSNRTLRRRLAVQLEQGLSAQETLDQIADRVRNEFNLANTRATTIARTEIGRAVEEARHLGREQAGTPLKSWLWSRRETGRPWHAETERLTLQNPVPNHIRFQLAQTGSTCDHPRATGVAQDDINCGCTTLARFPGDGVKSVLDRYTARGFLTYERMAAQDQTTQEHS